MAYVSSTKTSLGRTSIPDGMRRPEAEKMWAECSRKADWIMCELEKAGVLPAFGEEPEEQMAKKALHEAFSIAMAPVELKMRLTAIRTVLEWTKAKPATKTDLRLNSAEAWLAEVVADHKAMVIPSPVPRTAVPTVPFPYCTDTNY
jgi:hypothetical protein